MRMGSPMALSTHGFSEKRMFVPKSTIILPRELISMADNAKHNTGDSNERQHDSAGRFKPGNPWRFKPGQSGNPGGRARLLGQSLRDWLAAPSAIDPRRHNADVLAERMVREAINGNVRAAIEIRKATEGDLYRYSDAELIDMLQGDDTQRVAAIRAITESEGSSNE